MVKGFCDADRIFRKVAVRRGERHQFIEAHAGIKEQLQRHPCPDIGHVLNDLIILVERPEIHGSGAFAHVSGFIVGIDRQIIINHSIIEDRGHHILNPVQISVRIALLYLLVLPVADVLRRDGVDRIILEIGQNPILENVPLAFNAALPEPVAHVLDIAVIECLKGRVRRSLLPFRKDAFPLLNFTL